MDNGARIGIIVLNYNGKEDTVDCLKSLCACSLKPDLVLVVDNGSSDGSREELPAIFGTVPNIRFLFLPDNLGYAGGNNRGIETLMNEGHIDVVMLLNNDTIVDPDFLLPIIEEVDKDPVRHIITPKILFPDRKTLWSTGERVFFPLLISSSRQGKPDTPENSRKRNINSVTGCAMIVKKEVFKKIGLLDENYFAYVEELDFCKRAGDAGFRFSYCPESVVIHRVARSLGSLSPSQLYLKTRNRCYFIRKNVPLLFRPVSWTWYFLINMYWAIRGVYRGDPGIVRAIWKGYVDCMKGRMGIPNWQRILQDL